MEKNQKGNGYAGEVENKYSDNGITEKRGRKKKTAEEIVKELNETGIAAKVASGESLRAACLGANNEALYMQILEKRRKENYEELDTFLEGLVGVVNGEFEESIKAVARKQAKQARDYAKGNTARVPDVRLVQWWLEKRSPQFGSTMKIRMSREEMRELSRQAVQQIYGKK